MDIVTKPGISTRQLWPSRNWWVILSLILVCAALLRYSGYNFSLPYIDHVDEPAYNIAGRMIIDNGSAKPIGMQGYPPGIIELNYVLLRFLQKPNTPPGSIIGYVRLISITFSIFTIIVIALISFRIASPIAGLLAATLWTFTPEIVEHSRYATADNFTTFFTLLAAFLIFTGTRFNRDKWIYIGNAASSFAIVFKYQAVFTLPVLLLLPLVRLRFGRDERRHVLRCFLTSLIIQAVFFSWLVIFYPASEAGNSPDWSAKASKFGIPSANVVLNNLNGVIAPLSITLPWVLGILGLVILVLWAVQRKSACNLIDWLGVSTVLAAASLWLLGVSLYGSQGFRQFISLGAFLTILVATGLTAYIALLKVILTAPRLRITQKYQLILPVGIVIVLLTIYLIPGISGSVSNAYEHTLHDRRNDLATWADMSLASGKYIAESDNHKTFSWDWGGYGGTTQFSLENAINNLAQPSIEDWRAKGVTYAILPYDSYESMKTNPAEQTLLSKMTLLKTYPKNSTFRGPNMAIFRLYPIQQIIGESRTGVLGSIRVIGYDIDHTKLRGGETIHFTIYWRASSSTDVSYSVFNHLIKADTNEASSSDIIGQIDGTPLYDARRATNTWDDPNEILMSRGFELTLPNNTPAGVYSLVTGFYRPDTGERLHAPDDQTFIELAQITVKDS